MKISSLKRHYETKHRNFVETFPQNSEVRTTKINARKSSNQAAGFLSHLTQQKATQCSLFPFVPCDIENHCPEW